MLQKLCDFYRARRRRPSGKTIIFYVVRKLDLENLLKKFTPVQHIQSDNTDVEKKLEKKVVFRTFGSMHRRNYAMNSKEK